MVELANADVVSTKHAFWQNSIVLWPYNNRSIDNITDLTVQYIRLKTATDHRLSYAGV